MNETDQTRELLHESANMPNARISRRALFVGGAGATAVGIAGLAAGIAVGAHEVPPAPTSVSSRQRFANKVVMITGATSGIGRAAAIAFAREGARVTFCGRREALGAEVEQSIRGNGGTARYFHADVRLEANMKDFADFTVKQFGRIDIALNNAGITLEKSLHEYSADEWDVDVLHTKIFAACSSP